MFVTTNIWLNANTRMELMASSKGVMLNSISTTESAAIFLGTEPDEVIENADLLIEQLQLLKIAARQDKHEQEVRDGQG